MLRDYTFFILQILRVCFGLKSWVVLKLPHGNTFLEHLINFLQASAMCIRYQEVYYCKCTDRERSEDKSNLASEVCVGCAKEIRDGKIDQEIEENVGEGGNSLRLVSKAEGREFGNNNKG